MNGMILPLRPRYEWQLRSRSLMLGQRTLIMGILNLTPDSFSDGGQFSTVHAAVQHALHLLDAGADIIDIGGESTRPGAGAGTSDAISSDEEQRRVLPVIAALLHERPGTIVSIDTYRATTARAAVALGAEIVNDVSGMLWDTRMAGACAELRCGVVAMHTRGLPSEWKTQTALPAHEVISLVANGLRSAAAQLMLAGCDRNAIVLDPGFGFGKRGAENWVLLREMDRLLELGFPLLAGVSRKGFISDAIRHLHPDAIPMNKRDGATAGVNVAAALAGAHILRVHDTARTVQAVAVADALRNANAS
jgi:dihydropteroate synthase